MTLMQAVQNSECRFKEFAPLSEFNPYSQWIANPPVFAIKTIFAFLPAGTFFQPL